MIEATVHKVRQIHQELCRRSVMVRQYLVVDKVDPKRVWNDDNDPQRFLATSRLCNVGSKTVDGLPATRWGAGINMASEALRARHLGFAR